MSLSSLCRCKDYVLYIFLHLIFFSLCTQGFLIDGFPLDDEQAEAFVSDIGQPTAVIHLEANDTILIERLKSR